MRILLIHNRYQQAGGEDGVVKAERALLQSHGHEVEEYSEDNHRVDSINRMVWRHAPCGQRKPGIVLVKSVIDSSPM